MSYMYFLVLVHPLCLPALLGVLAVGSKELAGLGQDRLNEPLQVLSLHLDDEVGSQVVRRQERNLSGWGGTDLLDK